MYRVGIGQDSHRVKLKIKNQKSKVEKPLILGGIVIDRKIEVVADSDGDVIIHSLCNALNSAIGGGSFSSFADSMRNRGITDSREYLREALRRVNNKRFKINNASIAVEANILKLEKHREYITSSLAKLMQIDTENIGLTFTSGEGLTSFGKGKGIQAFCIVSLQR